MNGETSEQKLFVKITVIIMRTKTSYNIKLLNQQILQTFNHVQFQKCTFKTSINSSTIKCVNTLSFYMYYLYDDDLHIYTNINSPCHYAQTSGKDIVHQLQETLIVVHVIVIQQQ